MVQFCYGLSTVRAQIRSQTTQFMRLCEDENDDNLYDEARAAVHHKRSWKWEEIWKNVPLFFKSSFKLLLQSLPSTSMAAICNIDVLICLPVCSFFVLILFFTLHSFPSIFLNNHYWSIEIGRQFVGVKLQGSSINDCVRSTNIEFS